MFFCNGPSFEQKKWNLPCRPRRPRTSSAPGTPTPGASGCSPWGCWARPRRSMCRPWPSCWKTRSLRRGWGWGWGEVAFPFEGAPETLFTTPADKSERQHLFTLRGLLLVLSHAECAWIEWIMCTCQHAWMHCVDTQHKNKPQTDTNFLRVGTCNSRFTRSAQLVICCETVRRQKQNCTTCYSLYGRLLTDKRYKGILWT